MAVRHSALIALASALAVASCTSQKSKENVIFACEEFTVYTDSVVQGPYTAVATSATEITTNYRSADTQGSSPRAEFRFSINSRDNEFALGLSHHGVIGVTDDHIYKFGDPTSDPDCQAIEVADTLKENTEWTIRVDMRDMLREFARNGSYTTATGDIIYADDFKGVWIAGSVDPLSWDFENLYGKHDRKLVDRGDSIFEVTITMNPPRQTPADPAGWRIDSIDTRYPQYSSNQKIIDAVYNMGIANIASNIRSDETFRAGKEWDGVWTRDVAYSIYLSLAYLDPQRSINSLRAKVADGRIIQDTGTGGAWPVSSDRVVWAAAAWEIYLVTGDRQWLKEAFETICRTLDDDIKVVWDPQHMLMHGEQSYLDWREQTYPRWMQPADIYESMCLGTNVMFAQAFKIRSMMAAELGIPDEQSGKVAGLISRAIKDQLWMPQRGYFSEYLYGAPYPIQSQSTDNLGQALSIIFDIASPEMAKSIMSRTPRIVFGTPSVYPQLPDIKPYHNNAVWPFVQAYWNIAAAKAGNAEALNAGLAAIYRPAALFSTHKELFVASNGDYRGTAVNSDSQLWSCAGAVAMNFRVFAGMNFTTDGIEFAPFVPSMLTGEKRITDFKYRNATLDIIINGTGNKVLTFEIDGHLQSKFKVPGNIEGRHTVRINLADNRIPASKINIVDQHWMPSTPIVGLMDQNLKICNFNDSLKYQIYINGVLDRVVTTAEYKLAAPTSPTAVAVTATDAEGLTSFSCRPIFMVANGDEIIVEANQIGSTGTSLIANKTIAQRFVEVSLDRNRNLEFNVEAPRSGDYFVALRYANGSGPINTENKCAIRSLYINGERSGAIVMPQRGINEWLSTGMSNTLLVHLNKGTNRVGISFDRPYDVNMNVKVNTALIEYIQFIKK